MRRVNTILWDVGGVLLTNGWDHNERDAVLGHFNVQRDLFEQRHAEANDPWEKDLITAEEYLRRTVFVEPRDFTPSDFLDQIKAQSKLLPNTAIGILRQLAAAEDLELGMLNNESRVLNDFRIDKFGLADLFDCFISSCYVGLRKPDPRIYEMALDLLQRDPAEVAFIDDREKNIAAAVEVGMRGIQYKDALQLATELQRIAITVTV